LIKQARLLGILYLENGLSTHVFTPARISVLKLLASEAAISLENSRLYGDIQEREARVRRLFNANIIGIFTWNLDGQILDANESFKQIIGRSDDDIRTGLSWKDLMPATWNDDNEQRLKEVLAKNTASPFEMEYVKKDGSRVPVLVGAALFEGTPTEGVSFVLDLTELKRAERVAQESTQRYREVQIRLSDANRVASIGQLSASIAHELNQPLSGIIMNATTSLSMLAADPPNLDGVRAITQRTLRDGNRASEVVQRLRAMFARKQLEKESVDLNETAREVLVLSSNELQVCHVILRTDFDTGLPPVSADRVQIQQVILNLILNAADAMKAVHDRPRNLLIVTAREEAKWVRLSVSDSGHGIDPQNLEKVFDAFYTTKTHGMGVGLSISRSIIESHKGRLWATTNDGPGATFSFSIPCGTESASG
jgi:PAS domain S-box-containing protein